MFDTAEMDFSLEHEIEQVRRSVAMLPPGHQALDRETALSVLHRLQAVSRRVSRLEGGLRALLDEAADPDGSPADLGTSNHPSGWSG